MPTPADAVASCLAPFDGGAADRNRSRSMPRASSAGADQPASRRNLFLFDRGVRYALLDRLNGVFAVGLGLVPLARGGDDLPVGGFEPPTVFLGIVLVD